ncbi:RsmE family RNA methyltransferase [Ferruginibacter profundus]
MALPFFYKEDIDLATTEVVLDEDTSKHVVQVLRMKIGEQLQLTNGKGNLFTAEITGDNRKKCAVTVIKKSGIANHKPAISIAISLVKNNTRFEWFLEKATEIGVTEIIPLICERTEKTAFKFDRMKSILVSAMLQSQQTWLPVLHEPVKFATLISKSQQEQKFIAHCEDENNKVSLAAQLLNSATSKLILIGPEGDFTREEIETALKNNFVPVALGDTRLRAETAGIVAATLLVQL